MPYLSSTRRAFPKTISTRFLFDHFLNVLIDFCFVSDSVMAAEVEMIENNECEIKATLEYRVNKMSNVEINKQYLVEFKNGIQTEMRKCLRCDLLVKAPNGGTTGLNKHYKSCVKKVPKRKDNSQSCLGFPKSPKLELPKGLKLVAQMVYKDQIPVNTVANSSALQHIFQSLNFGRVNYHTVNKALDDTYHRIVTHLKAIITNRDKDQMLARSFDKWTSQDGKKFIGVYLYVASHSLCLGIIPYQGFCGSEEIASHLRKRLAIFNLTPSDISIAITDCGADVRCAAEIMNWYTFPCLAHVINLCVKTILLRDPDRDILTIGEDDNEQIVNGEFLEVVDVVRRITGKVHSTPKIADALEKIQRDSGKVPLKIVRHNETRWNSLHDCIERFVQLKNYLKIMFVQELDEFDWDTLSDIKKVLQPFIDCTQQLQSKDANIVTAKKVILFLQSKMQNMPQSIKDVFKKWIDNNVIWEAVSKKKGDFYELVKERLIYEETNENDHAYNMDNEVSFEDFSRRVSEQDFIIEDYLKSFRPASVDPERLFSLCRFSKNYLQCRLTAEHHSRNVFINKNERFLG